MMNMNTNPIKEDKMAVIAIIQFVANIMMIEPINKVNAPTRLPKLWYIDIPIVSTSFVTRDKMSP